MPLDIVYPKTLARPGQSTARVDCGLRYFAKRNETKRNGKNCGLLYCLPNMLRFRKTKTCTYKQTGTNQDQSKLFTGVKNHIKNYLLPADVIVSLNRSPLSSIF